jgi:hypothetical protein
MSSRIRRASTRASALAAIAAFGVLALAGCDLPGTSPANGAPAPAPSASAPASSASSSADPAEAAGPSGSASSSRKASTAGTLPDVCQLLSRAEVTALTGKQITTTSADDRKATSTLRYCQWQLNGGQLVVTLSRATKSQFDTRHPDARTVTGLGADAYVLGGHLLVFRDGVEVDVYNSAGASEAASLETAKKVAVKVLSRM